MRKLILLISCILMSNIIFGQTKAKEYFLERSKKQKTTAWLLLGTGATAVIIESMADNSQRGTGQSLTGGLLTFGGVICTLTSIPFFISSSKNKKRATTLTMGSQRVLQPRENLLALKTLPTVSLKISLNK